MVKTCHNCEGYSDDYSEANLKRCSGCRKVYYCSTTCQKYDWVRHIFSCKPRRPINTAYYLALAVRDNLLPEHSQTCEDYGFTRVVTAKEKSYLLGLYIGLIKYMEISPKTIHDWRVRGVLVEEIKAAFYKLPQGSRGEYFKWFLQNEHIVAQAGQPLPQETLLDRGDAMLMRAWAFIGGNERDSARVIRDAIAHKPEEEQSCLSLYTLLLSTWHPSPELEIWIAFGFAACRSQEEEMELGSQYRQLINKCTFKEFCNAYDQGRLLDLFRSKGMPVNEHEALRDLLAGGRMRKSVWHLKQTIEQENSTKEESSMVPSVVVDYGFMNCKNDSERRQLKRVYKAFFGNSNCDPLALHEAAIKGNIHGYLSSVVQGLRDPKFERLMKNPYPLPDL